jgi:hypothetical protein
MNKKIEVWKEKRHALTTICYLLIIFGISFNYVASVSNDCKMPVYDESFRETYISENNLITNNKDKIENFYFTDIFIIEGEDFYIFFSIGDIMIFFSSLSILFIEFVDFMKDTKENNKNKNKLVKKRKHGK